MSRKNLFLTLFLLAVFSPLKAAAKSLNVVTTLPDYARFVGEIGRDRVSVRNIVLGDQDAHFVRPKPSFVNMVRKADVLITTGLDLELWVPTIIDKSGNTRVRSGRFGYVAVSKGINLLEKPKLMSRSEGGLHIYGNPHITSSPLNMRTVMKNIAYGLIKNDPENKKFYLKNLKTLQDKLDKKLFGSRLVKILGGDLLAKLAEEEKLIPFLRSKKYQNEPLINYLGGWMEEMMPLRGEKIATYHKNWVYFLRLFGLEEAGTIEPKPGIPPSPKHVSRLIETMKKKGVKVILAASYFDRQKINSVAARVGAQTVIVPVYSGALQETPDYFSLVDYWISSLKKAFACAYEK